MSGTGMGSTSKPSIVNGVEETLKDFWASRPRRPHANRKVAGVAAGIGHRYGIDPVVVRVAFVAATVFGGAGLALYLLGWLFLPDERDRVSAFEGMIGRGRASMSTGFTVMLCIVLVLVATGSWFRGWAGGWVDGSGVISLALMLLALYLLHRNRGEENRPVVPDEQGTYGGYGRGRTPAGDAAFTMTEVDGTPEAKPVDGRQEWDPLGADPKGWDLPDPTPPPPPAPPSPPRRAVARAPRNRKVGPVTFGLALLVAAAGVVANVNGVLWFSPRHIVGLTLAVLGAGLVIGAFLRGGRGLIGLAIALGVVGGLLTAVPASALHGGFGDIKVAPRTAADLQPLYQRAAGDIDLDLRGLKSSTPLSTTIAKGAGNVTVIVPETADVTYSCTERAGDIDCLGKHSSGVGNETLSGESPGAPDGLKLHLDITNGAGNVVVRRG